MYFSRNLQFLRKRSGMTQETLAQHLAVSRQAVSKWESGETMPELPTLLQLSVLFSCKLDDLLRQELTPPDSPVRIVTVKGFSMVRYCMISPNALEDVQSLLRDWARSEGIDDPSLLLWSFPYVTEEQKNRFCLEGFEAACVLPDGITLSASSFPVSRQPDGTYAMLTMEEPDGRSSTRIAQGIRTILETLHTQNIQKSAKEGYLPCFEHHCRREGKPVVDLFLLCQDTETPEVITLK